MRNTRCEPSDLGVAADHGHRAHAILIAVDECRPQICRRFAMAGPYCLEVRADYSDRNARGIPLTLY